MKTTDGHSHKKGRAVSDPAVFLCVGWYSFIPIIIWCRVALQLLEDREGLCGVLLAVQTNVQDEPRPDYSAGESMEIDP